MTDLKCCPFCGEEPAHRETIEHYQDDDPPGNFSCRHSIDCDTCGFGIGDEYEREAIAAWNLRALTATGESKTESSPEVTANVAERILRTVRSLIAAEDAHSAQGAKDFAAGHDEPVNTTRDDADFWHASLGGDFTVADCNAALKLVRRRRAAALSVGREGAAQGRDAVRVKPLEWKLIILKDLEAKTPFGIYVISVDGDFIGGNHYLWVAGQGNDEDYHSVHRTMPEAKSAAQADYTARILSALDTSPEGMVEERI